MKLSKQSSATSKVKLFGSSCQRGFRVIVDFNSQKTQGAEVGGGGLCGRVTCPGDVSIDNQEEGDGDFAIHCNDLIKDDSAPVTTILEFFKHTVFIDADKNHDDCGE